MILKSKKIVGVAMAMSVAIIPPALESARAESQLGVERGSEALLSRRISLGAGKTLVVDLPKDVAEIVVGDPKVADAIVRTPRKIYIMAGATGQTTIIGFDSAGRQVANLEVSVGRDVGELMQLLKVALPHSNVMAQTVNDVIILTGEVGSAGEAKRAVDLAKGFASRSHLGGGSRPPDRRCECRQRAEGAW